MIYSYQGIIPYIHESAFIHPQATITGNVRIGEMVYVGPGAAIRGDWGAIEIENGCNIQENCTIHMFPGVKVLLEENAHIGHGAIIHGAHIGKGVLIGMNAVVMDRSYIGNESIIGALTFIKSDQNIPMRSLVVGNPGKIIKEVSDKMAEWKKHGTKIYQNLASEGGEKIEICNPLRIDPGDREMDAKMYKPWDKNY
jgi:carbonic anhydrase/acetyltransferase-like protein (isoleucine patch superfamily)